MVCIIKYFLQAVSSNRNNALDAVRDVFILQGMSDGFCSLDFSAWIETFAFHIDRQHNTRDSPSKISQEYEMAMSKLSSALERKSSIMTMSLENLSEFVHLDWC